MPRSRSRSIESSSCGRWSRGSTAPVISRMRSASVDFPWSMWAMIEKLRMLRGGRRHGAFEYGDRQTDRGLVVGSDMDVVRAVFAAFTERDVEGVLAHAAPTSSSAPVTGDHAGPDRALPRPRRPAPVLPRRGRGLGRAAHRPGRLPPGRRHDPGHRPGQRPLPGPNRGRLDGLDLASARTAWWPTPACTPRRPRRWRRSRAGASESSRGASESCQRTAAHTSVRACATIECGRRTRAYDAAGANHSPR